MPDALLAKLRDLGGMKCPPHTATRILELVGIGDRYFQIPTPLGRMFVAYGSRGVTAVSKATSAKQFQQDYREHTGRSVRPATQPPRDLVRAIQLRLAGDPKAPKLEFDLRGMSEFEQAVLHKALEIPRGQIRPYAWVASEIGKPKAVRAVGSALGANPVPLLIPCHRVVRSDGHIGEYGLGGPRNKRRILSHEGVDPDEMEAFASEGARFIANDRTHAVCYPTCYNERERQNLWTRRDIHFYRGIKDALAAGYEPCAVCRPAVA